MGNQLMKMDSQQIKLYQRIQAFSLDQPDSFYYSQSVKFHRIGIFDFLLPAINNDTFAELKQILTFVTSSGGDGGDGGCGGCGGCGD